MLLKLIKTREFISGAHCEVWEVNPVLGDRLLAEVFVLNEHLPLELIYRLTVTRVGICFAGRQCGWRRVRQQDRKQGSNNIHPRRRPLLPKAEGRSAVYSGDPGDVEDITAYLREVQRTGEEIRIEVCRPKPELPGYPEVDYHPDDFPIVFDNDLTMIQTTPLIEEGESCLHSPHHNHYVRSRRGPRLIMIDDLDEDEVPEEPSYELEDPEIEPLYR